MKNFYSPFIKATALVGVLLLPMAGGQAKAAAKAAMSSSGKMSITKSKTGPKLTMVKGGMAAGAASVTGPVKGAVSSQKTFVIARKGGPVTVDASKAKIRDNGKFASISAIKGGVMVTAKGSMNGPTLAASEITVHSRAKAGGAKSPAMAKKK